MASVIEHELNIESQLSENDEDDFIDNLPLPDVALDAMEVVSKASSCSKGVYSTDTKKMIDVEKGKGDSEGRVDSLTIDDDVDIDDSLNSSSNQEQDSTGKPDETSKLASLGYNTALAIGLHNFPEGLATFVAALDDPKVGAVLAFAIAVHNIPEGLCVSLPIYYATGSRWKGFMWGVLSGCTEVLAAIFGWIVLTSILSPATYGVLFGLVSGMMVIISIQQLLPTAHSYDPDDKYVTYFFIGGMAIIALSLVLFRI